MTTPPKPITGRCLCGAVTYSADAEPVVQAVCHCTDCQRQTGNPFSVIVAVPRDTFNVEGRTLASFVTTGEDHGGDTERKFCSACGSPVFSIAAVAPQLAFIKAGSLDDASWLAPAVEAWTRSAQPWSPPFENTTRFERGPR
jgi:hypothetical protein